MLFAQRLEGEAKLVPGLIVSSSRDDYAAWIAEPLQPGCDVDSIAIEVVPIDDHVTQIYPHSENDPGVLGNIKVLLRGNPLNFDSACHGINNAGELDQRPVAHELDDPAVVPIDQRFDEFAAKRFEPRKCARLVQAHQSAVPHHVGGEDSDQLAFQMLSLFHFGQNYKESLAARPYAPASER